MYKLEIEIEKKIFLKNEKKIHQDNESNIMKIFYNFKFRKEHNIVINYKYIILILLIIFIIITFNIEDFIYNKAIDGGEIFQKYNSRYYLKSEMIKKFNSFIRLCHNSKLFNITNYPLTQTPKISAIMPIYNGGKYLKYSLRSIQNQDMKDIEIILIDDFSSDNSIIVIEQYMEKDPRIRLIKNNKNKKILYSKSIGALNSNGEYIIQLDQDDMFIREDAFNILYYEAKNHNLEIVQMRDFVKNDFFFKKKTLVNRLDLHFIYPQNTHYKIQPELKDNLFADNNNYLLWGLLIKSNLYKKAIYHLWPIIINYKIIFNEDYIITSMIAKLATKFKYINKFILIHLKHSKSISNDYNINKDFYLTLYFYIFYLYEYYVKNSSSNIKIIINYIYRDLNSFKKGMNLFPKMFDFIIKIILNNDYLSLMEKRNFLNQLNIKIKKYEINKIYKYIMNDNEFNNLISYQNFINDPNYLNKLDNILICRNYKISIIIYCLEYKYLSKTLYSILNQIDFGDNEIIIIYDNNNEVNLKYFKNLTNEYKNIKLISNKGYKGILYSYSIGVLNASGKYILFLQPGYTLAKKNSLTFLYSLTNDYNLDILEFNLLINKHDKIQNNSLILYKCSHFESIKDLNAIKRNEKFRDIEHGKELLFNKLIKINIFKKIIYKYKLYKHNITIFNYYENILIFLLNKYNLKFRHVEEYGVIQNKNNIAYLRLNKIANNKNQLINDSIFYINFLFDNSKNTIFDKKYVFQEFINILSIIYNKFVITTNNSIQLIEKFINCKYINIEDKIELKFLIKSLIN